jgi:transitional endoplasmic reticulum ATPase
MGSEQVLTTEMLAEVTAFKRKQGSTASDADATWDRLILPEKTLTQLQNTVTIFKKAEEFAKLGVSVPRGILLSGPAGTGKTQVARTMAKEGGLQFLAATTADLKAGYIGQSGQQVKELFARARACTPCILFLDELDIVAPERSRTFDYLTHEIVGQLLQELDGVQSIVGKIFLLGATNHPDAIDAAILSRFPSHIEIPLPDEEGREKILRAFLGKKPVGFDLKELRVVARRLEGKSGRDIRSIVERAEQSAVSRAIKDGGAVHFKIQLSDLV